MPNPSFEQYSTCPTTQGEVVKATGWNSYGYSPDYFNTCAGGLISVPSNFWGYQFPANGNAYVGASSFGKNSPNIREYIGGKLSVVLIVGVKYNVFLKVVLANTPYYSGCPIDNIGILFSTKSYSMDSICPPPCNSSLLLPPNRAHVYSSGIISDSANWTTISGSFIADSTYEYMIIGNLFDDANTTYLGLDTSSGNFNCNAYYFIDDVSVIPDSLTSIYDSNINNSFFVYPNPTSGEFTIYNSLLDKNCELKITNVMGETVLQKAINAKRETISLAEASGVYFLHLKTAEGAAIKKIIKE